ncbi:MAG: hypothetical protein J6X34_06150 [Clostridia bacterium]|nr:hypothetical protein [Clostridia bacterium]MBP5780802.1 hypothetical protein [Clostridia bacterium]
MFGYTKAFVPNLRFREYDKYKAYYCGVCKTMGKLLGQGSRLSLTYEAATLAMLVDYCSFEGEVPLKKGRCSVHPGHSHPYFYGTPGIVYASRVNILLSGLAAEDNVSDKHSFKSRAALTVWKKGVKRAAASYPELYEYIKQNLSELHELEKSGCTDVDDFTAPFGRILGRIFTVDGLMSEMYSEVLARLGIALGQWIMLIDALDDRGSDRKHGNYNIYNVLLGDRPAGKEEEIVRVRCLIEAENCWQELKRLRLIAGREPDGDTEGFMDNLFSEGLPYIDRTVNEKACAAWQKSGAGEAEEHNGSL